jgi:hypothetical protein
VSATFDGPLVRPVSSGDEPAPPVPGPRQLPLF